MKHTNAGIKSIVSFAIFVFSSGLLQAQENGVNLMNTKSNKTVFLKENRRVLVETIDGKSFKGRFKTIDNSSIAIGKDTIAIDSVSKLKRRSLGLAFTSGVIVGGIGTPIIVASAATGGMALVVLPIGLAVDAVGFGIPLLPKSHRREKWSYSVVKVK